MDISEENSGRELQVYEVDCDGNLKVFPEFIELWELLSNVGRSQYRGGLVTSAFSLPEASESLLIGKPYLSDPTSPAPISILSFTRYLLDTPESPTTLDGPITNDGYNLLTSNPLLRYKVSWEILSSRKTKIGFYTSDEFAFGTATSSGYRIEQLNKLYLICGDKGPSLFGTTGSSGCRISNSIGSFTFTGYNNFYVAVNRDVEVKLKVNVIVPKVYFLPELSACKDYTKYLHVTDCGCIYKVPVYHSRLLEKNNFNIVTVQDKRFKKLYKLMSKYLRETELNLTLFFDSLPLSTELVQDTFPPQHHPNVPSDLYGPANSIRTEGLPNAGGSTWGSWEVSFLLARNLRQNRKYPKISFKVTVSAVPPNKRTLNDNEVSVTLQRYEGVWKVQSNINPLTGLVNLQQPRCRLAVTLTDDQAHIFEGFFILNNYSSTDFNFTTYPAILSRTITYDYIDVDYIDMPN